MNQRVLLVGLLLIVVIVAIFAFIYTRTPTRPTPLPTTKQSNTWSNIVPGVTSLDEVYQRLGTPISSSVSAAGQTLFYPSTNKYWTNDVSVSQNKVAFIRERVFAPAEISLKKRISAINSAPTTLYGPDSLNQMFLYVYPSLGFALYADPDHDVVYEVWYFSPTTLRGVLLLPEAREFSTSPLPASGSL